MTTPKDIQDTIAWYNANARTYAKSVANMASFDLLAAFVNLVVPGGKILDAGCGSGRDAGLLQSSGFNVIGVDISTGLLAVARENYPEIEFTQGTLLNLPFENSCFDGVWAHASLVHLETTEDVKIALAEFYRVLKPNSILHIYVKQQLGTEKTSLVVDSISKSERFFRWFTKDELHNLLTDAGFTVISINDNIGDNRPEVKWIHCLAKK